MHDPDAPVSRPIQFGLAKLIQFVTVVALWCAVAVVRESVVAGMVYTIFLTIVTWIVVGRWAVQLSPSVCRRVLAGTTMLLVAGGFGVTILVDDANFFPVVFMLTGVAAIVPWAFIEPVSLWSITIGIASNLVLLSLIYFFWLIVFGIWDRLGARPRQQPLATVFALLLLGTALPILLTILGGCYAFREHGDTGDIHHLPLHCVIHVGMLLAAGALVVLLMRHGRTGTSPPPNWLKLVTWGYLSFYAVQLQVSLFSVHFYIP